MTVQMDVVVVLLTIMTAMEAVLQTIITGMMTRMGDYKDRPTYYNDEDDNKREDEGSGG